MATAKRSTLLPDLPTIIESGLPVEATGWYGVLAPRATPRPVVAKLHAEVVKTVNTGATRERLAEQGVESVGSSPEEFAATIREEWSKWGKVIATAGLKQK
jgi:tripartite-type tricarboxylate transporter receptor subunit TctC